MSCILNKIVNSVRVENLKFIQKKTYKWVVTFNARKSYYFNHQFTFENLIKETN